MWTLSCDCSNRVCSFELSSNNAAPGDSAPADENTKVLAATPWQVQTGCCGRMLMAKPRAGVSPAADSKNSKDAVPQSNSGSPVSGQPRLAQAESTQGQNQEN